MYWLSFIVITLPHPVHWLSLLNSQIPNWGSLFTVSLQKPARTAYLKLHMIEKSSSKSFISMLSIDILKASDNLSFDSSRPQV